MEYQRCSAFTRFAKIGARAMGRPVTFLLALALVVIWAAMGPVFQYSTNWQLVINTSTTIVTFLMVFLIQNTQNRDSEAMQLKLDELIRSIEGAHNALLDLEELEDRDLDSIRATYLDLAASARESVRLGNIDTGRTELKDASPGTPGRRTGKNR